MKKDQLDKAILKRALGYETEEVVEEYASTDNELKLSKRKVTKKYVPPDLSAIKMVMDTMDQTVLGEYQTMTKEQLMKEKIQLLNQLEEKYGNQKSKNRY